jgi:peptidoglycan/LPS O-acetylase OafA/YrhL
LSLTKPLQNSNASIIKYSPQLDGFRFIAILVVIIYHQYFTSLLPANKFFDVPTFIIFFFVLSSYLITKILLVAKQRAAEAGFSKVKTALAFLFRRTLRIFPAYYFYLLLVILFPVGGYYLRQHWGVFFLYLSNFLVYHQQSWDVFTAHLWTLAVEEQFYLIWPWLILFTPNRYLPKLFYLLIAVGIGFRLIFYLTHPEASSQAVTLNVLSPASADGFGFGALLAYQHFYGKASNPIIKRAFFVLLPLWFLWKLGNYPVVSICLDKVFACFLALYTIESATNGIHNKFGKLLQSKAITYLGKISYGIYLYHLLARFLFWKAFNVVSQFALQKMQINLKGWGEFFTLQGVSFSIDLLGAIGLASASWYFLEQPINNLRTLVKYSSAKAKSAPLSQSK